MVARALIFVVFILLGSLLGRVALATSMPEQAERVGVLLAIAIWFAIDSWLASRVLAWLAQTDEPAPASWGIWAEVLDRVRRMVRLKNRQIKLSQDNLDQFLQAIQASPNGVLVLDPQWRITWCNTMSAQHLGIDPARDMAQLIGNLVRNPDFNRYLQQNDHSQPVIIDGRDHRPDLPQRLALQLFPYGHGQHLLLTAAQRASQLTATLLQTREHVVHPGQVLRDLGIVAAVGAHQQILFDAHAGEYTTALGHHGQALADQIPSPQSSHGAAMEDHLTTKRQARRDGFHGAGFARAVGAYQAHQLATLHIQVHALHSLDAAVTHG